MPDKYELVYRITQTVRPGSIFTGWFAQVAVQTGTGPTLHRERFYRVHNPRYMTRSQNAAWKWCKQIAHQFETGEIR